MLRVRPYDASYSRDPIVLLSSIKEVLLSTTNSCMGSNVIEGTEN